MEPVTCYDSCDPLILITLLSPGFLDSLGMMQRTKWGWVLRRFAISLFRFSCIYTQKTVLAICSLSLGDFSPSGSPCGAVKPSGRKLLFSSSVWFEIWGLRLKAQKNMAVYDQRVCCVAVGLAKYPCQSGCSSQRSQPSVYWPISGTLPLRSHLGGLCFCPASPRCCTAPGRK